MSGVFPLYNWSKLFPFKHFYRRFTFSDSIVLEIFHVTLFLPDFLFLFLAGGKTSEIAISAP